jgi:rubrerythrin
MKRDFRSLTAQEALHVAMFIEERNAGIYHQLGEVFAELRDGESLEIARAFWEMAAEERHHESLLQKRYVERFGMRPCHITEDEIRELVEVPRLEGQVFDATKAGPLPRQRAFEVAERAETQALDFYKTLAEITADARMRAVYREFMEFESAHCEWVKRKLAEEKAAGRRPRFSKPDEIA